jgi:hypothetical protein
MFSLSSLVGARGSDGSSNCGTMEPAQTWRPGDVCYIAVGHAMQTETLAPGIVAGVIENLQQGEPAKDAESAAEIGRNWLDGLSEKLRADAKVWVCEYIIKTVDPATGHAEHAERKPNCAPVWQQGLTPEDLQEFNR